MSVYCLKLHQFNWGLGGEKDGIIAMHKHVALKVFQVPFKLSLI